MSDNNQRTNNVILMLWGPNFELLGKRQPDVYGSETIDDHVRVANEVAAQRGLVVESFQTSSEQEMVHKIHEARGRVAGIVINPAAFTHYAWAVADALAMFEGPIVEFHLSHTFKREPWRHQSVVSPVVNGTIVGFALAGSKLAVEGLLTFLA